MVPVNRVCWRNDAGSVDDRWDAAVLQRIKDRPEGGLVDGAGFSAVPPGEVGVQVLEAEAEVVTIGNVGSFDDAYARPLAVAAGRLPVTVQAGSWHLAFVEAGISGNFEEGAERTGQAGGHNGPVFKPAADLVSLVGWVIGVREVAFFCASAAC